MRLIARLCCVLTLFLGWASIAHASVSNAPGANLEVSLITYGPGETYWERFGHDAIQVRDTVSGESVDFNYGVFDFDERGFLLNFARGRMHYLMDAGYSESDQRYYRESGRSITRQVLNLTPDQTAALRDFLLWNLKPENARYDYDYYADNCTTRVRDALDKALGGVLKAQMQARAGGMTYRQQTARLMSAQPWLMLVLDLGLGPYADRPLTAWEESFLPMVLQREVAHVMVADGHGGQRVLAGEGEILSPNRLDVPPEQAPDLRPSLALAGLILALLILGCARFWPLGYALLGTVYLVAAGVVGLLLIILWTLTTHHSAWANANLLMFSPLAFVLIPSVWRARRGVAASRRIDAFIAMQLIALLVALGLHLLPGVVQQNQPWLLFGLPVWLALAWSLRRGLRRVG